MIIIIYVTELVNLASYVQYTMSRYYEFYLIYLTSFLTTFLICTHYLVLKN